jgi:hypothetical protein
MSEQEKKMPAERRISQRVELITDLKYLVILPSSQTGLTKNISEGGLCFLVDHPLAKGIILQVEFNLPKEEDAGHVKAIVEVLWQRQEGNKFVTGVKFLA